MLRLFSLFGKSPAMNALDDALRAVGVHPILVPEAVKITVLRLLKRRPGPEADSRTAAAELLALCILGVEGFAEANGPDAAAQADERLEAAVAAGDSDDAQLVLLALHAQLLAPEIAARIEADER